MGRRTTAKPIALVSPTECATPLPVLMMRSAMIRPLQLDYESASRQPALVNLREAVTAIAIAVGISGVWLSLLTLGTGGKLSCSTTPRHAIHFHSNVWQP